MRLRGRRVALAAVATKRKFSEETLQFHQKQALNVFFEHTSDNAAGYYMMPPGTGRTQVISAIIQKDMDATKMHGRRYVIFVPWLEQAELMKTALSADGLEVDVVHVDDENRADIDTENLKEVVICTYASVSALDGMNFRIKIVDEVHILCMMKDFMKRIDKVSCGLCGHFSGALLEAKLPEEEEADGISNDYYEVLGVERSAQKQDIKDAKKKLAVKYHPDLMQHRSLEEQEDAADMMAAINEAFEVLSDEDQREIYDAGGIRNDHNLELIWSYSMDRALNDGTIHEVRTVLPIIDATGADMEYQPWAGKIFALLAQMQSQEDMVETLIIFWTDDQARVCANLISSSPRLRHKKVVQVNGSERYDPEGPQADILIVSNLTSAEGWRPEGCRRVILADWAVPRDDFSEVSSRLGSILERLFPTQGVYGSLVVPLPSDDQYDSNEEWINVIASLCEYSPWHKQILAEGAMYDTKLASKQFRRWVHAIFLDEGAQHHFNDAPKFAVNAVKACFEEMDEEELRNLSKWRTGKNEMSVNEIYTYAYDPGGGISSQVGYVPRQELWVEPRGKKRDVKKEWENRLARKQFLPGWLSAQDSARIPDDKTRRAMGQESSFGVNWARNGLPYTWLTRCERLKSWISLKKCNGSASLQDLLPDLHSSDYDERSLAIWLLGQRRKHLEGTLPEEHLRSLQKMPDIGEWLTSDSAAPVLFS